MPPMPLPPDDVLIAVYKSQQDSTDRITLSATARAAFLDRIPTEYQPCDPEAVASRLVYLRKKGRLPRLKRVNHKTS